MMIGGRVYISNLNLTREVIGDLAWAVVSDVRVGFAVAGIRRGDGFDCLFVGCVPDNLGP